MSEQEEIENLRTMRNAVAYGGEKNSLISWINSPEWSAVGESATKASRGTWFTEHDVYWGNETSGEIPWR